MPDPILDEISLTTKQEIFPGAVQDNFFLAAPFLAYLRGSRAFVPFTGGADMREVFLYGPMVGGAFGSGDNFNINQQQILAGSIFDPRFYQVSIPIFKEQLEVLNRGPEAVYKLIDIYTQGAVQTISAIIAVALHRHGQASGTGVTTTRTKQLNGWVEAMSDGITNSWNGDFYTSYGTQPRNAVIATTFNSEPYWAGTQAGATQDISYDVLETRYQVASRGNVEPDLGVCNKRLYSGIKSRIQPQQRFLENARDPYWGVSGMKMNSAMILKDDYFPAIAPFGQNQAGIGNWLSASFTSAATVGAGSNMPTSTTLNASDVFNWYNTATWKLRVSDHPDWSFGLTDFYPAQDNTRVVARVLAALNLVCIAPWANQHMFGFK